MFLLIELIIEYFLYTWILLRLSLMASMESRNTGQLTL
jgi:hypothetical protein